MNLNTLFKKEVVLKGARKKNLAEASAKAPPLRGLTFLFLSKCLILVNA